MLQFNNNEKTSTVILSVLFIILYGSGFVAVKLGFPFASPLALLLYRSLISAVMFLVLAWIMKAQWPENWRQVGHIAVSGFFLIALFCIGTWISIDMGVPPATSALIIALQPLMVSLASHFLFKNAITAKQWLGLMIGLIGVILVVGEQASFNKAYLIGILMSFLGLFSLTIGSLYQKRYCAKMNIFSGGVIQAITTGIVCLILSLWFGPLTIHWTGQLIFSLFWMCIIVSLGAISLLYILLKRGESHKVASLFYLIPATTALISYFVFHTTLDEIQMTGMIVATLGVGLVNFKFQRKRLL